MMNTVAAPSPLTPDRIDAVLAELPSACAELRTLPEQVRCELRALHTPAVPVRGEVLRDYLRLRVLWPLVRDEPARARASAERIAEELEAARAPELTRGGAAAAVAERRVTRNAGLTLLGRVTEEELNAVVFCRDALTLRFG